MSVTEWLFLAALLGVGYLAFRPLLRPLLQRFFPAKPAPSDDGEARTRGSRAYAFFRQHIIPFDAGAVNFLRGRLEPLVPEGVKRFFKGMWPLYPLVKAPPRSLEEEAMKIITFPEWPHDILPLPEDALPCPYCAAPMPLPPHDPMRSARFEAAMADAKRHLDKGRYRAALTDVEKGLPDAPYTSHLAILEVIYDAFAGLCEEDLPQEVIRRFDELLERGAALPFALKHDQLALYSNVLGYALLRLPRPSGVHDGVLAATCLRERHPLMLALFKEDPETVAECIDRQAGALFSGWVPVAGAIAAATKRGERPGSGPGGMQEQGPGATADGFAEPPLGQKGGSLGEQRKRVMLAQVKFEKLLAGDFSAFSMRV